MNKAEYLAGLFDGEGCVTYKQYWSSKRDNRPSRYLCWRIQLEIVMTHKDTVQWCCDNFGGRCIPKPRKEYKMQYRWRRGFKDAYNIATAIHPYAITKKEELKKIIDHYDKKEEAKEAKEDIEYSGGKAYRVILKMFHDHKMEDKKNGNHTRLDRQHKG